MGKRGVFGFELLHIVLAEMPQAQTESFEHEGCRKLLGDGNQGDLGTLAPCPLHRVLDAFLDLIQAFVKHSASRSITAAGARPSSWPAFSTVTSLWRAGMMLSAVLISSMEPKGSRVP